MKCHGLHGKVMTDLTIASAVKGAMLFNTTSLDCDHVSQTTCSRDLSLFPELHHFKLVIPDPLQQVDLSQKRRQSGSSPLQGMDAARVPRLCLLLYSHAAFSGSKASRRAPCCPQEHVA